ncbi:MAG TPA: cupin domain-containing protein [Bacteroidia bacterium]|nr:cupin domain-containing protein [Bacteroidia bacterium]
MAIVSGKETAPHYIWGENCDSWVLANTASLSVKQENMPPGTKEQLHFHSTAQQFFFILKGTASFICDNKKDVVFAKSGILIPAGTKHFIANETKDELEFLVVSQPSTTNDRTNC